MKELDVGTFVAVFHEMLGPWLWVIAALAVVATLLLAIVLVRDRGIVSRRLVWAEVAGLGGGVAAVLVMQGVTHSGFSDIGGPVDWVLIALIFAAGAAGATIGVYGVMGLLAGPLRTMRPDPVEAASLPRARVTVSSPASL